MLICRDWYLKIYKNHNFMLFYESDLSHFFVYDIYFSFVIGNNSIILPSYAVDISLIIKVNHSLINCEKLWE